jgi:hypothetical protein
MTFGIILFIFSKAYSNSGVIFGSVPFIIIMIEFSSGVFATVSKILLIFFSSYSCPRVSPKPGVSINISLYSLSPYYNLNE